MGLDYQKRKETHVSWTSGETALKNIQILLNLTIQFRRKELTIHSSGISYNDARNSNSRLQE